MAEHNDRSPVDDGPRSATEREWDVFVREETADPLRHVGSVTAPSPDVAHEQASSLFDRWARDVWLCPADAVHRYTSHSLAESDGGATREADTTERGDEP